MRTLAFAVLLTACAASGALAETMGQAPVEPAARVFHIGSLEVTSLLDAQPSFANDGKIFGADVGPQAVSAVLAAAGAPTDRITLSVDALLVTRGKREILVDTGLGPAAHGLLIASLAKAGYRPEDISDVLITHVHRDHVGGLVTAEGGPAFPNAVVKISAPDWTWLQGQADMSALVKVITPQVKTFTPGDKVAPSIRSISIKGHTPGHVGYQIVSGQTQLLDMGDTAHSSIVSLAKPDWAMGFDNDRDEGKINRRAELTKLAKTHEMIFAPHFPFPGIGRIVAEGDHFVWRPAVSSTASAGHPQ